MMKRFNIWSPPVAVLLTILGAAFWLALGSFAIIDEKADTGNFASVQPLGRGQSMVQTFIAPGDDLSGIGLYFDKPVFQASGELNFELAVADEPPGDTRFSPGRVIRQGRISISQIDSFDDSCHFTFEPVPDSGGREFALRLSLTSTTDATVPVFSEPAPEPGRSLYVDGRPVQADLGMSFFHDAGIMGLLDRLRPFRPAGLSSPAFLLPLFLIGAGCLGWLLWQMAAGTRPAASTRKKTKAPANMTLTVPDDSGKTGECL